MSTAVLDDKEHSYNNVVEENLFLTFLSPHAAANIKNLALPPPLPATTTMTTTTTTASTTHTQV